jgi:hypothetical protein
LERLFADFETDEKKKLPASKPRSWEMSAIEPAIAVFPVPFAPFKSTILFGSSSLHIHAKISRWRAILVCG